jgi:hypothetical protein
MENKETKDMTEKVETAVKQKIDKLTPEQEAKMPEYVAKWIAIGTNTDRLDPVRTRKTIDQYRALINRPVDVPMIILDNPLEAWAACHLITNFGVKIEDLDAELDDVFNGNPKKYDIPSAQLPWQSGSFFAATFSFYDFMFEEVGVEIDAELYAKYKTWEATSQLGCIYPMEEYTIVSEKPTEIHLNFNAANRLHRDGGPALSYAGRGDLKVYSLNGVRVPEYIAVTDEEKLDLDYYKTITNADVKAEFVRKAGIERFKSLGKLLDTWQNYQGEEYEWWHKSQYELWDMEAIFDGLSSAPYLSMVNQTTDIFHFEGVSPDCQDLKSAIKQRLGGRDMIISAIA